MKGSLFLAFIELMVYHWRGESETLVSNLSRKREEKRNDRTNTIPELPNWQDLLHRNPCHRHCRVSPVLPTGLRLAHKTTQRRFDRFRRYDRRSEWHMGTWTPPPRVIQ